MRWKILTLVIAIVLAMTFSSAQTTYVDCDEPICGGEGHCSPGTVAESETCTVSADQIVNVDNAWDNTINAPEIANWTFNKLVINEGVTLWFINSAALTNDAYKGSGGTKGGPDCGDGSRGAGGLNPDSSAGGYGGYGEDCTCDCSAGSNPGFKGGGGGGGGAGGIMFLRGSTSGKGGDGRGDDGGAGGTPVTSDVAGANVLLVVKELVLEDNAGISVSGKDGSLGDKGDQGVNMNGKSGGGSGGSGGSGAGRVLIFANLITASEGSFVSATGGRGGKGGDGGSGEVEDGGGGGGGGGGNGGEIAVFYSEGLSGTLTILNVGGIGGEGGDGGDPNAVDRHGYSGLAGQPVEQPTIVPQSNKEFFSIISQTNVYDQCIDGNDNDFDGFPDFSDVDCYNTNAELNVLFELGFAPTVITPSLALPGQLEQLTPYVWWKPFASETASGNDSVCGDDYPVFADMGASENQFRDLYYFRQGFGGDFLCNKNSDGTDLTKIPISASSKWKWWSSKDEKFIIQSLDVNIGNLKAAIGCEYTPNAECETDECGYFHGYCDPGMDCEEGVCLSNNYCAARSDPISCSQYAVRDDFDCLEGCETDGLIIGCVETEGDMCSWTQNIMISCENPVCGELSQESCEQLPEFCEWI